MSDPAADNYAIYFADKLWNLLPAIYRALDTDQFALDTGQPGAHGPLREMVNRIGATTASVRRSMDRMWENQSIETCDDWVIPYIADLLDTRLVLGLDPSRQRLDVANTIDYRRRKGTIGVLEQIASDITGWDAKVVEFFRRLGRTRHGLDPPVGPPAGPGSDRLRLQQTEALVGPVTRTQIGGFADLRDVYGAGRSRGAFDEFFHTADTRTGQGVFGWHAIPHLGIFVWRLLSFGVGPVTPVAVAGCPGWYCFDPTGRNIPLFAAQRAAAAFGDGWVSPTEGQLPTPISQALLAADIKLAEQGIGLYPVVPPPPAPMPPPVMSVAVGAPPGTILPASSLTLRPAYGRFFYAGSPPTQVVATYTYGFPSMIGAGPYDRRGQAVAVPAPAPSTPLTGGGTALTAAPSAGTVTLGDSLTYAGAPDVSVSQALTLRADNKQRPLLRLDPATAWTITGTSADATLAMDGLFVSGEDIVLSGTFAAVTLTCCTFDPGSAATSGMFAEPSASPPASLPPTLSPPATSPPATSPPGALFQTAADGRDLAPTRLWIEATITTLTIDRCVLGPIRTRGRGNVETTTISNSTLQAIRTSGLGPIAANEVKDPTRLLRQLQLALDPVSALLRTLGSALGSPPSSPPSPLSPPASPPPFGPPGSPPLSAPPLPVQDLAPVLAWLNAIAAGPSIYQPSAFAGVKLSAETQLLLNEAVPTLPTPTLNRLLLEDAFPLELADAAIGFSDGKLALSRCTVIGRIVAHRLDASECILQDLTLVDDLQDGCVRFTAWAAGSTLPRQYESVSIAQAAPLFTSTDFGQPGYAQLRETVDLQRLPPISPSTTPRNTISAGAADASEMGAYARDKNPIRAQALLLKLQEYMPAGLLPVIVNVT